MRKIFLTITGLVTFSLAFGLPLLVIAATVTTDAAFTLSSINSVDVTVSTGAAFEEIVVNDNNTLTITTGNDGDISLVSSTRNNLGFVVDSGSPTITGTCTTGSDYTLQITSTDTAVVTITPDPDRLCDATTATTPSTTVTGGGSGGGGSSSGTGSNTLTVDMGVTRSIGTFASSGTNLFMYVNSQINFKTAVSMGGEASHSAKVTNLDLTDQKVTIVFSSTPATVVLSVGQVKEVDLDEDGVNDVKVKFNALTVNKADLTFTTIAIAEGTGDLVKLECGANAGLSDPCKAVYYLGNNGKRYVFPNVKTYNTWYNDFSTVRVISAEDLAKYPIGGNVTYRPGVKLVKIQTDPKVYAVAKNGSLRWVSTAEIVKELYGASWASMVEDIPDAFFINYTTGVDIGAAAAYSVDSAKTSSSNINTDKGL